MQEIDARQRLALADAPELMSDAPPPPHPPAMAKAGSLDDPSVKNADEVASALGADLNNGLTSPAASLRLAQDGPNERRAAPRWPAWHRVLAHFQVPLVYLLLAAIAIALVAWVIEGWVGWPVDALVMPHGRCARAASATTLHRTSCTWTRAACGPGSRFDQKAVTTRRLASARASLVSWP